MSDYMKGDRVRFLGFGEPDPYSRLRVGTEGTVSTVDDIGTVHIDWDDGGRLGMVVAPPPGQRPDRIELVRPRSARGVRDPATPEDRPST